MLQTFYSSFSVSSYRPVFSSVTWNLCTVVTVSRAKLMNIKLYFPLKVCVHYIKTATKRSRPRRSLWHDPEETAQLICAGFHCFVLCYFHTNNLLTEISKEPCVLGRWCNKVFIKSVELSPSWYTDSWSGGKEIPYICLNRKIRTTFPKSLHWTLPGSGWIQFTLSIHPVFSKIILMISSHLRTHCQVFSSSVVFRLRAASVSQSPCVLLSHRIYFL
jgi:hypothetical protein